MHHAIISGLSALSYRLVDDGAGLAVACPGCGTAWEPFHQSAPFDTVFFQHQREDCPVLLKLEAEDLVAPVPTAPCAFFAGLFGQRRLQLAMDNKGDYSEAHAVLFDVLEGTAGTWLLFETVKAPNSCPGEDGAIWGYHLEVLP